MPKRVTSNTRNTNGAAAERIAEHYLIKQGYRLLERNFHSHVGEVDLIMQHGNIFVFIEVRYRANNTRGNAAESVTSHKYQRCYKTALYWLMKNNLSSSQFQIDVVALDGRLREENITWLQAV